MVTYVAKDEKGFINLYHSVKENIFRPAAMCLPTEDELKARIQIGLHFPGLGLEDIETFKDEETQLRKLNRKTEK